MSNEISEQQNAKPMPKIYVAVTGIPDCGKSTFIRNAVEMLTGRKVCVDALCNEQIGDRTIRSASILCHWKGHDIVLLDCPGHLEYKPEIESCLTKSQCVIFITDKEREGESHVYTDAIAAIEQKYSLTLPIFKITSHSNAQEKWNYNASVDDRLKGVADEVFTQIIETAAARAIDPETTALRIIDQAMKSSKKCCAMCSYGKDSVVLLEMFKKAGVLDRIDIFYPNSGYDLPGISPEFIQNVQDFYGTKIVSYPVIHEGWTFENHSVQEMMLSKAEMLTEFVVAHGYDMVFLGCKREDAGVRSKSKFFAPRKADGSADLYESQLELFGDEFAGCPKIDGGHIRCNPLLDFSEMDIWKTIKRDNLPVCSEYYAVDGKRYRSLGDWPITDPMPSEAKNLDDIIAELEVTRSHERDCRLRQDTNIPFGFEEMTKKGFFG